MVFFIFLNFFAFFLEFSIPRRVGTKRNDNFYFLSFSSFLQLFLARNEAVMVFFKSSNFFAIFFEFLFLVGLERNGTIIFIFSFSHLFQSYFGLKRIHNCIYYFFEFFCYFFGIFYYASGWNET